MTAGDPVSAERYGAVAISFHWLTAALIAAAVPLGLLFHRVPTDYRADIISVHRSLGLTILVLTAARMLWRAFHAPPPLLTGLARWERALALLVHAAIYVLLLALPLSGWIMLSAGSPPHPVGFWGVAFPPFPFPSLSDDTMQLIHNGTAPVHRKLAWCLIGLVGLHVVGALKHHLADRNGEIGRMLPPRPSQVRVRPQD